jgi:hypothetical protein
MSLSMSNSTRLLTALPVLFALLFPTVGICADACEFEVSCINVAAMTISYGPAPVGADPAGDWPDAFRCAIELQDRESGAFERAVRQCVGPYLTVTAEGVPVATQPTAAVPVGEWLIFYDTTLNGALRRANAICAEKVQVDPSARDVRLSAKP